MKTWCVYLTMYSGDKLPKWYIGSSYEEKVLKGYNGSVCSKEYRETYINEQKENKHLFKTRILSKHIDSISARAEELRLQKMHNVVKNKKYINKSLASVNGYFGMEKSASDKLLISVNNSNKVVAKDLNTNKLVKVSKEEFDSNVNLVGATIGKSAEHLKDTISVINKDNEIIRINKADFDLSKHQHFRSNTIAVRDVNNNITLVSLDDERYLSGELVHINKNKSYDGSKISKVRKELGLAVGNKNPRAIRLAIYNSDDDIVYVSYGDYSNMLTHNGLSALYVPLYNTKSKNNKLFETDRSKKWAKSKNVEQYAGWYLREISKEKFETFKETLIINK